MDKKNLDFLTTQTDERTIDLIYLLQKKDLIQSLKLKDKDHLIFEEPSLLQWVIKQGDKKLQTYQKWKSIYYKEDFQKENYPKFILKKINSDLGYGLFASEIISKGEYLGEYTGIVRVHTRKDRKNPFLVLYPIRYKYFQKLIIDGSTHGNHTRFINHSNSPNAAMISIIYQNIPRMIFTASQGIEKGSQIMMDYGKLYFKQLKKKPYVL